MTFVSSRSKICTFSWPPLFNSQYKYYSSFPLFHIQQQMRKIQTVHPFSLSSQNSFLRQYSAPDYNLTHKPKLSSTKIFILNTVKVLLQDLKYKNRSELEKFVKSKSTKYQLEHEIGLAKICSLVDFKYILFGLIQAQQQNYIGSLQRAIPFSSQIKQVSGARKSQIDSVNSKEKRVKQQIQWNEMEECDRTTKGKKTNIYIDFDFSQMIQKCEKQVSGKQSLIQRLQNLIIEKEKEIQLLEDQNQQMRVQIQSLLNRVNSAKDKERAAIQRKLRDIQQENKVLNEQANDLATKIAHLQSQNDQPPQQLFRRCLFSQAVTLQNFLSDN